MSTSARSRRAFVAIRENPQFNWSFVQRGLWVHSVDTLMDYLRACVRVPPVRPGRRDPLPDAGHGGRERFGRSLCLPSPAPRPSSASPQRRGLVTRRRRGRFISSAPTIGLTTCSEGAEADRGVHRPRVIPIVDNLSFTECLF
jgi:hypothetical protein